VGLQFVRQNWWMLVWLADNLLESPNAAIRAEHAVQVLRFFKVASSFLNAWATLASRCSSGQSTIVGGRDWVTGETARVWDAMIIKVTILLKLLPALSILRMAEHCAVQTERSRRPEKAQTLVGRKPDPPPCSDSAKSMAATFARRIRSRSCIVTNR
jgi:hypothetical protein